MNEEIQKAVEILKSGGIIIFPTDTAFGIGCDISNEKAIERLFAIRKRPRDQAVSVLVNSMKMAQEYLLPIPKEVLDNLIKRYWPGALTIILPCITEKVPSLIRAGGKTLGVRMPNNKIINAVIKGLNKPILGPSANFHGEKTPYELKDLDPELIKLVDYVVISQDKSGEKASTVIDCSKKPWQILRKGAVRINF